MIAEIEKCETCGREILYRGALEIQEILTFEQTGEFCLREDVCEEEGSEN